MLWLDADVWLETELELLLDNELPDDTDESELNEELDSSMSILNTRLPNPFQVMENGNPRAVLKMLSPTELNK